MYRYYQDVDLLAYHYDGLRRYVDQLIAREGTDGLVDFNKYGDWCPPGSVIPKKTPREITSAFYYYHDVLTLSKIAQVLGNGEDAAKYAEKAQEIRQAFNKKYFNAEGGYYGNNDQTSNVLGLQLGLVPEGAEEAVVDNLVEQIAVHHDYHFDTGIVGTKFILDTLTRYGLKEVAYRMMTQESYPSLGYMIKSGATTVWERWEKLTGTGMNSHNHIMFGTVDVWFYRSLAGIALGQPGWDGIVIKPCIPQALDYAGAALHTLRGPLPPTGQRARVPCRCRCPFPSIPRRRSMSPVARGQPLRCRSMDVRFVLLTYRWLKRATIPTSSWKRVRESIASPLLDISGRCPAASHAAKR